MPSLVARVTDALRQLESSWPMSRKWIGILQRSPAASVDQVARADVAGDVAAGVIAHISLGGPLNSSAMPLPLPSHHDHAMGVAPFFPPASAPPSLGVAMPHMLPPPGLAPHPSGQHVPMQHLWGQSSTDGLHALAVVAAEHPSHAYAAPGMHMHPPVQYVDMPFGDPTQQHSFHDVLAYMNGGEPR
jgi:hypothetical protein